MAKTPKVVLQRIDSTDAGTIGRLMIDGEFLCFTVELPWRENQRDESCIPGGIYDLGWYSSPTKGSCLHVQNVPNRDYILFHVANYQRECKGCIFPGRRVTRIASGRNKGYAAGSSADATHALELALPRYDDRYVHKRPITYKLSIREASRYV